MKKRKSYDYARFGYLFSLPFVIAWLIFQLYPILYTVVVAFTSLAGAGNTDVLGSFLLGDKSLSLQTGLFNKETGLFANFFYVFSNNSFSKAFGNTLIIWIANFVPQMILALLITAWFTNRRSKIKGQGFFKVIFYMPNIITASTVAILFNQFFGYPKGAINDIFHDVLAPLMNSTLGIFIKDPSRIRELNFFLAPAGAGSEYHDFLRNAWTARGIVIFIQTWMWYGYTAIVMISGVLGISPELFEAAEVDGANQVQTFFKITLPSIKTMLLFTLVTSLIGGLNMFDIPKLFNDGGPDQATTTTSVFIYNQAFAGSFMYGKAAAASLIMFIVIVALSAILFYLLRDKEEVALRKLVKKQEKEFKMKQKLEMLEAQKAAGNVANKS